MAAEKKRDSRSFFRQGGVDEWDYAYSIYSEALHLKAQQKRKPEELVKLDTWYQEELPKLIQSRKEKHVTHDELVQTMKWKLARGKFYPQLTNLVRINTPLAVTRASKKAFKKLPNLTSAIQSLTILKGVGPAMASAVLAAGAPEYAPFMADECLLAMPNVDSIEYTVQEYLNFSQQIQRVSERLNEEAKGKWTPHRVELALWAHHIASEHNPALLDKMPKSPITSNHENGSSENQEEDADESKSASSGRDEEAEENGSGAAAKSDEGSNQSEENNQSEDTNDSTAPTQDADNGEDDAEPPESKRIKTAE